VLGNGRSVYIHVSEGDLETAVAVVGAEAKVEVASVLAALFYHYRKALSIPEHDESTYRGAGCLRLKRSAAQHDAVVSTRKFIMQNVLI
jgi:hypothetical protein